MEPLSNDLSETDTTALVEYLLSGDASQGDAAFERRNSSGMRVGLLSADWESSIVLKWTQMDADNRNAWRRVKNPNASALPDIRLWGPEGDLPEFQRLMRLNASEAGNLVCEVTGVELSPQNWSVDRVINRIVPGVSGEYRNSHCLVMHARINDMKEAGGRKIFASVETIQLQKKRRNITQLDHRVATQIILRDYFRKMRLY